LPCLTDSADDLEALISAAKQHYAQYAVPSVLYLTPEVKDWFIKTLQQHYPELLPAYKKLYRGTYASQAYADTLMKKVYSLLGQHHLSSNIRLRPYCWKKNLEQELVQELKVDDGVEQLSFSF
jgi:DNA repair photolyase